MRYGRLTVLTKKIQFYSFLLFTLLSLNTADAQNCMPAEAYENSFANVFNGSEATTYATLPTQCIETSMQLMEKWAKSLKSKSMPFAYCDSPQSQPTKSKKPLCRSEKLITNVHKLFQATMDCLDIPAKAIFPLFNVESGFFPNAVAPGGEDAGIGQMTPIAATDVNQYWGWLEAHVYSSTRSSCKTLAPYLNQLKTPENVNEHICQFVSAEVNPLRNALYSGFLFLVNTKYFSDLFLENNIKYRIDFLVGQTTSEQEIQKLIHLLSILSYNKGYAWMRDKFLMYIEKEEAKLNVDGAQLSFLNSEIFAIEKQIQELKKTKDITNIQVLREKLEAMKINYRELTKNIAGPSLELDVFHYRNFSKKSMIGFFKKEDSSHYIELVLSRNDAIEQKFGVGTCGDFEVAQKSSALDFMIW